MVGFSWLKTPLFRNKKWLINKSWPRDAILDLITFESHLKEMPRKIWVPYLRDAFDKEEETDSEHSKWLHSSETVYLKKKILIFFSHSFVY